jgi:hypothetical protein
VKIKFRSDDHARKEIWDKNNRSLLCKKSTSVYKIIKQFAKVSGEIEEILYWKSAKILCLNLSCKFKKRFSWNQKFSQKCKPQYMAKNIFSYRGFCQNNKTSKSRKISLIIRFLKPIVNVKKIVFARKNVQYVNCMWRRY